ncbi:PH domain-containing protein [Paenibacillus oenotherae]|uniref:PH domain-containing protein n=1 Tax=Paenibacillus oenotherae TaxID=1435645 RepID=A0ABS7DB23_9BACL|nr:PH domain-containing protein [Paenibacillus oenotherae]MBW7477122.1 PH domain-containing protein [Paenibacillus oenotherae]
MYNEPQKQIDAKALKAWQLSGCVSAAVNLIIVVTLLVLSLRFHWPIWIFLTVLLLAVCESIVEIVIWPRLKYRQWRYDINEDGIELKHGIIFRKRTSIPMVRIQHVDKKQGPILRRYDLATVTFSTAAGSHEIPALTDEAADDARRQIARLARISNEEV